MFLRFETMFFSSCQESAGIVLQSLCQISTALNYVPHNQENKRTKHEKKTWFV